MYIIDTKKSARFAGTFSLPASRAARFARKFERASGARFDRRAPFFLDLALGLVLFAYV